MQERGHPRYRGEPPWGSRAVYSWKPNILRVDIELYVKADSGSPAKHLLLQVQKYAQSRACELS